MTKYRQRGCILVSRMFCHSAYGFPGISWCFSRYAYTFMISSAFIPQYSAGLMNARAAAMSIARSRCMSRHMMHATIELMSSGWSQSLQ